jgi:hypothetical protein
METGPVVVINSNWNTSRQTELFYWHLILFRIMLHEPTIDSVDTKLINMN